MLIKGFYHIFMVNGWKQMVYDQLQLIIYSGLYNTSDKIYISCLGHESDKKHLEDMIASHDKFEIIFYRNDGGLAEIPILQIVQDQCQEAKEEFLVWYIHTKGIVHGNESWRKEMECLVIHQHPYCVDLLLGKKIGACGPRLRHGGFPHVLGKYTGNYHFSGNFWWAKSNYIRDIKIKLTDAWKANGFSRFMAEAFVGMSFNPLAMHHLKTCNNVFDADFDEDYYLKNSPDIKSNGYKHFLQFGRLESRKFRFNPERPFKIKNIEEMLIPRDMIFDEGYYLKKHPDVAKSIRVNHWPATGRDHYLQCGYKEKRDIRLIEKGSIFDENYYLENSLDVLKSIETTGWPKSGYAHYLEHGKHENRKFRYVKTSTEGKQNILIKNTPNLIGDFLGLAPALVEFSKKYNVFLDYKSASDSGKVSDIDSLIELLLPYGIKKLKDEEVMHKVMVVSLSAAFKKAHQKNWYMTQALLDNMGLPVVKPPPKVKLVFTQTENKGYDYLISPFSRCLPDNEKWSQKKWQRLVDLYPNNSFGLLGNSKYDNKEYVKGANIKPVFDLPFSELCDVFSKCRALISVTTGTSHLAFHMGVKNVLITNQRGAWGINPDALCIRKDTSTINAGEIVYILNNKV